MPDERRYLQTKFKKKTCNPKFEESFVFQVGALSNWLRAPLLQTTKTKGHAENQLQALLYLDHFCPDRSRCWHCHCCGQQTPLPQCKSTKVATHFSTNAASTMISAFLIYISLKASVSRTKSVFLQTLIFPFGTVEFEVCFLFSHQVSCKSMEERVLRMTVFDVDRHKKHQVIGHALYLLRAHVHDDNERVVIWRDLEREVSEVSSVSFRLIPDFGQWGPGLKSGLTWVGTRLKYLKVFIHSPNSCILATKIWKSCMMNCPGAERAPYAAIIFHSLQKCVGMVEMMRKSSKGFFHSWWHQQLKNSTAEK